MKSKKSKSYNDIPVYYCRRCLSLKIKPIPLLNNKDYCVECGSADVGQCSIEEWDQMYKKEYKKSFLRRNKRRY